MSLTIKQVHDRLDLLIKKNKWGYVSPQQKDLALDLAQMELFEDIYGDPDQYQYGRPQPPVAYGKTKKTTDSLSRFLKPITLLASDSQFTEFPSDYIHLDSAFLINLDVTPQTYHPLKLLRLNQKGFRLNSQLFPKTTDMDSAFITIENVGSAIGIQVNPVPLPALGGILAYYLSRPEAPVYGYTTSGRTITYDASVSTDLNWDDTDITNKIIPKAIEYIGMNLENDMLFQQGQIKDRD